MHESTKHFELQSNYDNLFLCVHFKQSFFRAVSGYSLAVGTFEVLYLISLLSVNDGLISRRSIYDYLRVINKTTMYRKLDLKLATLQNADFIERVTVSPNRYKYRITVKGINLLNAVRKELNKLQA